MLAQQDSTYAGVYLENCTEVVEKGKLVAGCGSPSRCYVNADAFYSTQLVSRVLAGQEYRIEICKSGETIIYQIDFLRGGVERDSSY